MTRPKVDPDKRQRIAQACDSCKRRKQKCNGQRPCNTCLKRNLSCSYGSPENGNEEQQSSPKRRMVDPAPNGSSLPSPTMQNTKSPKKRQSQQSPQWTPMQIDQNQSQSRPQKIDLAGLNNVGHPSIFQQAKEEDSKPTLKIADANSVLPSRGSTISGQDEEAVVYNSTRMLEDPTGRLLYVGDAATLSFLQLIRMIVDNVAGPSPFTMDPRRHRIVENAITLPSNIRRTHLLPDRQTANVLVEAYFTNTNGLVEVFHHKSFMATLETCYTDPLSVDPSWLCLLYLTFAIGLVMASPVPGTREYAVIQKLRSEQMDRAEVFYSDAKNLGDPSAGFEDAGFWSIQALTLMSVYMLAISKRNAAYALYGMAVRSAFALGLHREETMCIFSSAEQSVRRNLWRSLFVLDRFLSASLGRPTAIRESDCSGTSLTQGEDPPFPQAPFPTAANANFANSLGLEASVRSCHVIGVILEKIYSKRKISTKLAQEIADHCKGWPKALDPSLHWRQANSADPNQGIAILHVNLLHCHSIVLLTRPFFLFLMNKVYQERKEAGDRSHRYGTRMEKFAEACVISSSHTIALVQNALESRYLPHRNPFVLYFLFAAALVVLSNEFSALYHNPTATTSINNAINIMHYCAQQDPQANRLLFILTSFRDVVVRQQAATTQQATVGPQAQAFVQAPSMSLPHQHADPIVSILDGASISPEGAHPTTLSGHMPNQQHANQNNSSSPSTSRPTMNIDSPTATTNSGHISSQDRPRSDRRNSMDAFFDLARVSSNPNSGGGNDSNDSHSAGDAEIDFEMLWQWPNTHSSGITPGASSGIGFTAGGSVGIAGGQQPEMGIGMSGAIGMVMENDGQIDVQGISDSAVPLFGMSNAEFVGS